ncbi:formate dehydrogenase accessory protein [bacterium BMS3Bbin07]|nr:formate dehydrogenase accessory protein [bacterium BMS3Bbin07]HDH02414.1 formate dehydrogenase accessory sulfurtransferase FdhD [Nitrospirota bacterium]
MKVKGAEKRRIARITEEGCLELDDAVALERRLRISVNGQEVLRLYCSPVKIRELVVGLFMTEGIIRGNWCAERMTVKYGRDILVDIPTEGKVSLEGGTITSGCLGGITFERTSEDAAVGEGIKVERESLRDLFAGFQRMSRLYELTGCIHNAAVSDIKEFITHAEDIGRHNAVDKVIGHCILENITLEDKVMHVSGRLSSEMVSKCARWKIPVVVSRAAPTSLAIDIAERSGITMIGFMRASRFNIYTHPYRII